MMIPGGISSRSFSSMPWFSTSYLECYKNIPSLVNFYIVIYDIVLFAFYQGIDLFVFQKRKISKSFI